MNVDGFYEHLGLPEPALLDKRIYKRMVLEHGQLTSADKRTLTEDVTTLTWKYTLKPGTVPILSFQDDEREYLEVAIVEATLNSRRRAARIAEMIHRAIPYPVLLVMVEGTGLSASVAHKRFSLAEKGSIVAEEILRTAWIDEPSDIDHGFFDALALKNLPQVDFFALYRGMVNTVLARCCAELTGAWALDIGKPESDRRAMLIECNALDREITSLRVAIKNENRFAARVELNTRIKELEARLARTKANV